MKHLLSIFAVIAFTAVASFGQTSKGNSFLNPTFAQTQPIKSWLILEESDQQNYEFKLDETIRRSGSKSASIKSKQISGGAKYGGLLMQWIRADAFRGKRMRLSAFVKSENVEQAGFWFRIDGENMQLLGFDGMKNRFVKGSLDWSKYELVLEVPNGAQQLVFGAYLRGAGQIWIDDLSFEEVGREIPVTAERPQNEQAKGSAAYIEIYRNKNKEAYEKQLQGFRERNQSLPTIPANLDFESF